MAKRQEQSGWGLDADPHTARLVCSAVGESLARLYGDVLRQPLPPAFAAAMGGMAGRGDERENNVELK